MSDHSSGHRAPTTVAGGEHTINGLDGLDGLHPAIVRACAVDPQLASQLSSVLAELKIEMAERARRARRERGCNL